MRGKLRRRHRRECIVEAVIDFIGDETDAGAFGHGDQAGERLARHHGAGGIGRAADQHAFQRRPAMGGEQRLPGQRVTGFARCLDQHRFAAERGQDMAIRRIAGHRDRNPIARLEHGEKRQDESPGRTGGDHNPAGIHGAAIGVAIMPRDALAQRGDPQRRGIVDPAAVERGMGGRYRRFRRRRRRLPHFHVDDMAAGRFDARRRSHHVHHHERRHVASPRCRQQAAGPVSQCRIKHRYLLFGPPPSI